MEFFLQEEQYLHSSRLHPPHHSPLPQQQQHPQLLQLSKQYRPSASTLQSIVLLLAYGTAFYIFLLYYSGTTSKVTSPPPPARNSQYLLPKIWWLYTRNGVQTQAMVERSMAYYYRGMAEKMGYEVREVNSWTAYEWISQEVQEKIKGAMERVKIDVGVDDLLRMALMIEHGGLMVKDADVIFMDDLRWLQDMFDSSKTSQNWTCDPLKAKLFLSTKYFPKQTTQRHASSFIAAVPRSSILMEAFDIYIRIMTAETGQGGEFTKLLTWNEMTEVYTSDSIMEESINSVIERKMEIFKMHSVNGGGENVFHQMGLQKFKDNNLILDAAFVPVSKLTNFLVNRPSSNCSRTSKMLIQIKRNVIHDILGKIIKDGQRVQDVQNNSLMHHVLTVKGNKEMFLEELPPRNVTMCLITLQQMSETQIMSSLQHFQKQEFKEWFAIYFVKKQTFIDLGGNSNRTLLLESTGSRGRNIEIAVTKGCSHTAFAFLLNKGEFFNNRSALKNLAQIVKSRDVLGALVSLQVNSTVMMPLMSTGKFHRKVDGILNPKLGIMKNLTNHLRVFSVEAYRILPQTDLRDPYGKYYDDRIIFLMSFMDMMRSDIKNEDQFYLIKRNAHKFNVPRKLALAQNMILTTDTIQQIDMVQLNKTFSRIDTQSMGNTLDALLQYKIPFDKFMVFNEGNTYTSFVDKKGPELIPAIIHQAWLGGKIPPVKQYFFNKIAKMYPTYEMKLWTLENITLQNFPISYHYIKNLQQFNKRSPFNKFATMTDILRHEALYHYGGFWRDASMNFLRPVLDNFRKYKMVVATDKTLRHRWLQGMCFFGMVKEYAPLYRITNTNNLNRMNIYRQDPMDIAGPIDFRNLVIGREEYDPDILILSYETYYPGQLGQHPVGDLCTRKTTELAEEEFEIIENKFGVLKNCSLIYPFAFGIEHNRYGVSWAFRKY